MDDILSANNLFTVIIKNNTDEAGWHWLKESAESIQIESSASGLYHAFGLVPRKIRKHQVEITENEAGQLSSLIPGLSIRHWSVQQLSRIWLLMQLHKEQKSDYIKKIESLFANAEMNELVALYASLPFLAYPQHWVQRCAEGIRSNIGLVLEAILYYNPYPAAYLDEAAWNQLVLKAFFTDKAVHHITGLDERANRNLADTLFDYANERKAAGRPINIQLWRLVSNFLDDNNFSAIQALFYSHNALHKKAAALVCYHSNYEPAKALLQQNTGLQNALTAHTLTWGSLIAETEQVK